MGYKVFFCTGCGADLIKYDERLLGSSTFCPFCNIDVDFTKNNISEIKSSN